LVSNNQGEDALDTKETTTPLFDFDSRLRLSTSTLDFDSRLRLVTMLSSSLITLSYHESVDSSALEML